MKHRLVIALFVALALALAGQSLVGQSRARYRKVACC